MKEAEEAGAWGRKDEMNRKKAAVEKNDLWTVIYGSGALLTAAAGVYLVIWKKNKNPQPGDDKMTGNSVEVRYFGFSGIRVNYIYRF